MKEKFLNVLKVIGAAIMGVMVLVATAAIIWRMLANYISFIDGTKMFWANEVQQLLFHWVIVIGAILGYENRSHLNITVFYTMFKGMGKIWTDRIFNLITILIFGVILIWGSQLAVTEMSTRTAALNLSRGIFVYGPYMLLSLYVILHQLWEFIHSFIAGKEAV